VSIGAGATRAGILKFDGYLNEDLLRVVGWVRTVGSAVVSVIIEGGKGSEYTGAAGGGDGDRGGVVVQRVGVWVGAFLWSESSSSSTTSIFGNTLTPSKMVEISMTDCRCRAKRPKSAKLSSV
jgi:hypothetical protein